MIPHQLPPNKGATQDHLTATERNLVLKIGGVNQLPAAENQILSVTVKVHRAVLQVGQQCSSSSSRRLY